MIYDLSYFLTILSSKLTEANTEIDLLQIEKPFLFENSIIFKSLRRFQDEYLNAILKLSNLSFPVATIGTTSSGKSTLVNALVGRRIAPIEAAEMSGGVLRIKHDTHVSLTIEKTHGMLWEHGTWNFLEDESVYERIRNIMYKYHAKRKEGLIAAPQITVKGPLLALTNRNLLHLPDNMEVEFIDLPGLKSVKDDANIEVIRSQISGAFSLVTLDYLQTDEDNRSKLLKELENTIYKLGGRTDSMIFILNRVDAKGFDDEPLQKRIQVLKQEIKHTLGLYEKPDILPLCARLLYYAQCAWGTSPLDNQPNAPKDIQKHLVQALFNECASFLEEHYESSSHFEDWSFKLKRYIRNADLDLKSEDLRHLLKGSLHWSGGFDLWRKLQQKLHKSFIKFYLNPIVQEVDNAHSDLKLNLRQCFPDINLNTNFHSILTLEV
ncbi:dynamin family protein [Anabaena minutissima FACHB-250]|nr:dynamin family protein [Anabaena minutissima FACHB-250]